MTCGRCDALLWCLGDTLSVCASRVCGPVLYNPACCVLWEQMKSRAFHAFARVLPVHSALAAWSLVWSARCRGKRVPAVYMHSARPTSTRARARTRAARLLACSASDRNVAGHVQRSSWPSAASSASTSPSYPAASPPTSRSSPSARRSPRAAAATAARCGARGCRRRTSTSPQRCAPRTRGSLRRSYAWSTRTSAASAARRGGRAATAAAARRGASRASCGSSAAVAGVTAAGSG